MAAYDRGEEWLDRLREYLADNYRMLCGFFAEYLPQYPGTAPRGARISCGSIAGRRE